MEEEIWVSAKGYEGLYEISSVGRVRSIDRRVGINKIFFFKGKILSPVINPGGYKMLTLCSPKRKNGLVHRLVAEAFIDNPYGKKCVNHKNGIKTDNRLKNLEWCTIAENNIHAISTGLTVIPKGANHPRSKLKDVDIIYIRTCGKLQSELASEFGMCQQSISDIRRRKVYNNI